MILGIDQSITSTGYVVFDEEANIVSFGTVPTKDLDLDKYGKVGYIKNALLSIIEQYNITKISIEGLAFNHFGNATRDLAGLQFHIICSIKEKHPEVELKIITPREAKVIATGKGNAGKSDMLLALPDDVYAMFTEGKKYTKTKGLYDITDAYFMAKAAYFMSEEQS